MHVTMNSMMPLPGRLVTLSHGKTKLGTWFRVLMKVFSTKYTVQLGGRLIHLSCIWHSGLVSFAVVIVNCITNKAKLLVLEPGVSPGTV